MTKKHSKRKRKGGVNTPHDAFFKQALGDPQVAQSFLQRYLPPDLLKQADLSRLKAEDRHFVREDMRQFYADALFSLPIEGKTAFVYVLIEHTAKPKKWTPLQVFQYMFRILDDYQRKNPKSQFLPLVYPLILYSGKRPYRVSTRLLDLIEGPKSIAEAVFNQPIHLIELRNEDDDQLNQHKALAAYLLSLKHAMDEIPMRQIIEILGRLPESAQ